MLSVYFILVRAVVDPECIPRGKMGIHSKWHASLLQSMHTLIHILIHNWGSLGLTEPVKLKEIHLDFTQTRDAGSIKAIYSYTMTKA